jgi:heat shock protein HspQ
MQNLYQPSYEEILQIVQSKDFGAKALANFLFREIIEDVHAKYGISQAEMKAMNKEAVNRAAYYLSIANDKERMAVFVAAMHMFVSGWDRPEETEDIRSFKRIIDQQVDLLQALKK